MLTGNEIDLIEQILSQYKNTFDSAYENPVNDSKITGYINNSVLMKDYQGFEIYKSFKFSNSVYDMFILIVQVEYAIQRGKFPSVNSETQIIGFKKMNRNYGRIFIRPETFEDKVSEIFIRSEIDFPDFPKFSFRYYCLTDNESKVRTFAIPDRLELIEHQNEILIEVNEDILISKFSRVITYEDCESMIEFIKNI